MEIELLDWSHNDESGVLRESGLIWYLDPGNTDRREVVLLSNLWMMSDKIETRKEIRDRLAEGISRLAFDRLRKITGIAIEDLCKTVRIPYRTLARRKILKPDESDRVFRVGMVFQTILEVMGDLNVARKWFITPKRGLGGESPLECCETEVGASEVIDLLGRIEHGVFT